MKNNHFFILLAVLLYGCASNSKLSSSFGERKYNKGHFWNIPDAIPAVAAIPQNTTRAQTTITTNTKKEIIAQSAKEQIAPAPIKIKAAYKQSLLNTTANKTEKNIRTTETVASPHVLVPTDDGDAPTGPTKSVIGFIFALAGCLLLGLAILLAVSAGGLFFGGEFILGIFAVLGVLLFGIAGIVIYIKGIVYCIQGLNRKEKPRGLAIAGLALLIGIPIIALLIAFIQSRA